MLALFALLAVGCPAPPTDTAAPLPCQAAPGVVLLDGVPVADADTALAEAGPWSIICLGAGDHAVLEDHSAPLHELLPGRRVIRGVGPESRLLGDPDHVPTLQSDDYQRLEDVYVSDIIVRGSAAVYRVEAGRFMGRSTRGAATELTAEELMITGRWVFQDSVITEVLWAREFAEITGLVVEGSTAPVAVNVDGPTTFRGMRLARNSEVAIGIEEGGALMLVDTTFEDNGCDLAVRDGDDWVCVRDDLGHVDELTCDWEGTCL